MDEAHGARPSKRPDESLPQPATLTDADDSNMNQADVDGWENEGGAVPAASEVEARVRRAKDRIDKDWVLSR